MVFAFLVLWALAVAIKVESGTPLFPPPPPSALVVASEPAHERPAPEPVIPGVRR